MKKPFFVRHGLLLLMVVFFLAPFGMRGARLAVQRMKNDVKDWLPDDFAETRELDWFREHFLGEQFVVVSWEGCTGRLDDHRFMDLIDGFFPEVPPSERAKRLERAVRRAASVADSDAEELATSPRGNWPVEVDRDDYIDAELGMYVRQLQLGDLPPAEEHVGNQFGLHYEPNEFTNWGGQNEKWLKGAQDRWFFITPDGNLYQWSGGSSIVQPVMDSIRRAVRGPSVQGRLVASLGPVDGPWYYADPTRLSARLFKTVTTGPAVLHQLTGKDAVLQGDRRVALRRLAGTLFGRELTASRKADSNNDPPPEYLAEDFDPAAPRQTCIVITLTEAAKNDLRLATGRGILGKPQGQLLKIAQRAGVQPPPPPTLLPPVVAWMFPQPPAAPEPQIKLGGPSVDNVAIDEEGQITLVRLVGLSLLVGLGLSWVSFRSVNLTIMVFLVGGLSAVASLSFVYWFGSSVDAVLMSMPSLVYVLGLSGAVHIVNYYRDSIGEVGLRRAPGNALSVGWKPCTLAAFTTALGLLSLNTSHIAPIKKFGVFAALGVVATLLLLFTYLPAALQTWPPRRFRGQNAQLQPSRFETWVTNFWHSVGQTVLNHYGTALAVCAVGMVAVSYGLSMINTDVQLLKMFDKDAKIIRDYHWLEDNLGKLVPMELVVDVDPRAQRSTTRGSSADDSSSTASNDVERADRDDDAPSPSDLISPAERELQALTFLERMEIVHYIQESLQRKFGQDGDQIIGNPMSANTFAVPMPRSGGGFARVAERGGISRRLESHRDEFLASDYLRVDPETQSELWRISLRLSALSDIDYGEFVGSLKETIEPVMAAYRYRSQILDALAGERGPDQIRKASVYLVGVPFAASKSAATLRPEVRAALDAAKSRSVPTPEATTSGSQFTEHQTEVFAKVLGRLLQNAGLDLRDWWDPRFEPPDNLQHVVAGFDCVVLVGEQMPVSRSELAQASKLLVDARQHQFDPSIGTVREQGDTFQAYYSTSDGGQVAKHPQQLPRTVSVVYTGLVPVVYKAQRTLLESLIVSTGWAFVMIAVVMVCVVRSVRAGLLSMIPNVFPVLVVFGAMGWAGILVDIGSMMTASVAMGVAVDDTIHFLTWFRRGLDEGKSRRLSILQAYERVGMAMTQTTAIGGLGLSIFAFSTFTPTQRFGTLMLALLAAALVGDLIFLPALLASPVGRVFDGKKAKRSGEASSAALPPGKHVHRHDKTAGPNRPYVRSRT